jgi:putative transposase
LVGCNVDQRNRVALLVVSAARIVGGLSQDRSRWVACRPAFFLPVRVLSRLFRRLFLRMLTAAHEANGLKFFANHASLANPIAFAAFLAPLKEIEWVV